MLFKKSSLGWILIIFLSLSPIIPWSIVQPIHSRFTDQYSSFKSIAELLGLIGVSLFSLNFVLSTRMKILEDFFGGMNRMYIAHHIFGGVALILLLFHPLATAASLMQYSLKGAALYIFPGADWTINL